MSDNGVGMDEETRRHVFEPFFTTKEKGKGTGLGLPMVHGIVTQSGGSIDFTSEPGRGTTFRIHLPGAEAEEAEEKAFEKEEPEDFPALGGQERVLVVEDQEKVRDYAKAVLTSYGYSVAEAESGSAALQFCERVHGQIDLVLSDVIMPNMTGGELADRLRARWPGIKILFMSGYADDAIVQNGIRGGAAALIQKPFGPEQLAVKVREILDVTHRSARIVVADDESGVRGFLKSVLQDGGYEVIETANGKQAVKAVRAGGVDLVITDLVMPEQEGIETIRELRKSETGIGIIAISGTFGSQFLKVAQMLGADAVLSKPLTPEVLMATVAGVLKSRREAVRGASAPTS
jgi:CheY-like chemotaxis protein